MHGQNCHRQSLGDQCPESHNCASADIAQVSAVHIPLIEDILNSKQYFRRMLFYGVVDERSGSRHELVVDTETVEGGVVDTEQVIDT
jgi:hypothetical protein